jgi:hypothetical protein
VTDKSKVEAVQLSSAMHSLQVQNELLHVQNDGLEEALLTKKKQQKQSKLLSFNAPESPDQAADGAVFWSPRRVERARDREAVKEQQEEEEKLRKVSERELREANSLYKKQKKKEAKELREIAAARQKEDAAARMRECKA